MTQEFVTLPREVVEQAIDALYCTDSEEGSPAYNFELKAIEELRAALERPQVEQEPVAWIWTEWSNRKLTFDGPPAVPSVRDELTKPVWTPLYTRPQREPLTDEELDAVMFSVGLSCTAKDVARAIEAAHNIK